MTAGLPDGGTPDAFAVCTRLHLIFISGREPGIRVQGIQGSRLSAARPRQTLWFRVRLPGFPPLGDARHVAFPSAVIYG